ncbi:DUF1924 domain-containing protein [Phaeovulum sp.]|uniref:DUF1924 domain-containing protein n=1 Tax=Phaeovulum sp. TaxID=2934796 RepID=UPI002731D885|nr:DUF1924 domain-containing protein [Phaeovulum sp.]MDP1669740.1 DUF1924 domain-containing protein [Phaeovulum sp.]MDP2063246.1 DUF1924 domain-containing protein [Phaeovulum sp.]MDZ4119028.1 DUF1924 domain-containing protein [Phaeovulum sp.]
MRRLAFTLAALCAAAPAAFAQDANDTSAAALISKFAAEAGITADAETGKAFFLATQSGGGADTPSCSSCHTADPKATGMARTGKEIAPMALSVNPKRFTDTAFVDKWFGRNCDSVLGRECTATEKANVLAYFASI